MYFSIQLPNCVTKGAIDYEISELVAQKDIVQHLNIIGPSSSISTTNNNMIGNDIDQEIVDCFLTRLALNVIRNNLSFPSLNEIIFHGNFYMDLSRVQLICQQIVTPIKQSKYQFKLWFLEAQLSTQAISYLSTFEKSINGNNSNAHDDDNATTTTTTSTTASSCPSVIVDNCTTLQNEYYSQDYDNDIDILLESDDDSSLTAIVLSAMKDSRIAKQKSINIELSDCTWFVENLFEKLDYQEIQPGLLHAQDFPRQVKYELDGIQMNLKEALDVIQTCNETFTKQTNVVIARLEIVASSISFKALEYLLSQESNADILNNQTECGKINFVSCKLRRNETDVKLNELSGLFYCFLGHECEFANYRLKDKNEIELSSHVIDQLLKHIMMQRLNFSGCEIDITYMQDLLAPIVRSHQIKDENNNHKHAKTTNNVTLNKVGFTSCTFHETPVQGTDNATSTRVNALYWDLSDDYPALYVTEPDFAQSSALESVKIAMKLITEQFSLFSKEAVTKLVIRGNKIGEEGVRFVAKHLRDLKLRHLCLWDVGMTNDGLKELCKALQYNSELVHLDVSENRDITCVGLKFVLDILEKNQNLTMQHFNFKPGSHAKDTTTIFKNGLSRETIAVMKKIDHILKFNQLGHEKMLTSINDMPITTLLPLLLEKTNDDPSLVYWILQELPHVVI